jgi:tetratricopeptide (TPR) repeat protein
VRLPILALIVLTTLAPNVAAQTSIPLAGLAAEGEGRWADALRAYREHVDREPAAVDMWLRIADIEARLAHPEQAIAALQQAAALRPADADILARLSRAYAAQGYAQAALHAIKGALILQPDAEEHLRAAATLATWVGDYAAASDAYRRLRNRHPDETALTLAFARVNTWAGKSDAAAAAYREYLKTTPVERDAWLELARVESWRGNTSAALAALDAYRRQFGESEAAVRERAAILARGGRPREALRTLGPLVAAAPADPALGAAQALALAGAGRHGEAVSTLNTMRSLGAETEARATDSVVRSLLGTSLGPAFSFYDDSDGLHTARFAPKADIGLPSDTRIHAGYEYIDLSARVGSGLETVSGASTAIVDQVWAGASQRIGSFTLGGTVGQSRTDDERLTSYSAVVRFAPSDSLTVALERTFGFATISPRTVSLGLTELGHRGRIDWMLSNRFHLAVDGGYADLSDGNARWTLFVSPRATVARTQRLNLDLGFLIHQFGAEQNLDHGYYDPRHYQHYAAVVAPYWKASENIGVAITAGIGPQRDDASQGFSLGMNTSVDATFGIYREWMLKVSGSATNNRRLESGAFQGSSGGIVLLRRF